MAQVTARADAAGGGAAAVYLVRGDDESLVAQATRTLLAALVGGRDPALVVEEHGLPSATEELDIGRVIDAWTTPPFLVDRRVVVVRDAGRLVAADAARLAATLEDPPPSCVLVLVAGGGTVPQALVKAVGATGGVVDTAVGTGQARKSWLVDHLKDAPVRLDAAAAGRMGQHLGEDLGRLQPMLETLAAAYGAGAKIGVAELEPFLGEAGAVPPWDLTDAIDSGAPAAALSALHRMLGAGQRVPAEVMAIVHRHFSNMLRLDGAETLSPEDAARLLGVRSPFVAKKALTQAGRLGGERIRQAVGLIADADLDIRGQTALPPELVLEILVARLARLRRGREPTARR
jgi:DNA polymerase-3 subunit delta